MDSDEDLLLRFQRGSHTALEELFARYRQTLFSFFVRRLPGTGNADDLVQDTFIAVIKGASRYEPRSSVRAYLFGIAFNVLFTERRRFQSTRAHLDSSTISEQSAGLPERALWVRQALLKLDSDDREILMLREYEQLSYAEIATVLRTPINTVRSRLLRSRLALKQLLVPQENLTADQGSL